MSGGSIRSRSRRRSVCSMRERKTKKDKKLIEWRDREFQLPMREKESFFLTVEKERELGSVIYRHESCI
jgi:hypothetical protein